MSVNELIYFRDGKLLVEVDNVRVYKMSDYLYEEIGEGHTLHSFEGDLVEYTYQFQDFPKGDCLELGLGLGVASRYILTFPKVEHLTTVESNKSIIDAHSNIPEKERKFQLEYNPKKHKILHTDAISYAYLTKKMYDFIFVNCYSIVDEDTLPGIADTVNACSRILKRGGKMIGWLDPNTPEEHALIFEQIFAFV